MEAEAFHLLPCVHFVFVQKKTFFPVCPADLFLFCFCVHVSTLLVFLFMEACLERTAQSQSAQSSELWGNWRVVRGWSLGLIIRCFYGELPDFTKISEKKRGGGTQGSMGSRQAGLTPALVITLINNHDQCLWWMGLYLLMMTGGVWGSRSGVWGGDWGGLGDTGCWGEEDRREMNCSAPLQAHTLPFSR